MRRHRQHNRSGRKMGIAPASASMTQCVMPALAGSSGLQIVRLVDPRTPEAAPGEQGRAKRGGGEAE